MNDLDSFKINDRYQIFEYIGSGDTSVTYKGLDIKNNTKLAIKCLKPELTRNNKFISTLNEELEGILNLEHENIVNIKEFIKSNDKYYIIMEYIDGVSLESILRNNELLPLDISINIIEEISKGLNYAHSKDIIHRGLHPENILISKDNKVKITNFGLSKAMSNTWLTMTGTTISNVEYMSPEQAEGENIDYRSDIYSLGIIAYELFTGEVPFKRGTQTILQVAMKHISSIPELPSKINKDLPSWIENIIIKCIEKKASDRFQKASDIILGFDNRDNIEKNMDLFISSKSENDEDNIGMNELEYFLSEEKNNTNNEIENSDIKINKIEEVKIEEKIKIPNKKNSQIKLFLSILILFEIFTISIILFIYFN